MNASKKSRVIYLSLLASLSALLMMSVSYAVKRVFQDNAFKIKNITVVGSYDQQVDIPLLERTLKKHVGTGFFMLDTENIRQKVLSFPWVYEANVVRQWPDKLIVDIQQETVLARWSKGGYVSNSGRIFKPNKAPSIAPQTVFIGDKADLLTMMAIYHQVSVILNQYGQFIAQETLDSFGNLEVTSNEGSLYRIGRGDPQSIMRNFFKGYAIIMKNSAKKRKVKVADMRYNHGFSVVWQQEVNG